MFAWMSRQGKHRLILIVDSFNNQQVFYSAFDTIEFKVIHPLFPGILLRTVFFGHPVTLIEKVYKIIYIKLNIVVMGE